MSHTYQLPCDVGGQVKLSCLFPNSMSWWNVISLWMSRVLFPRVKSCLVQKKELELEMRLDFFFFPVMERTKTKELTSYSWPVPIGWRHRVTMSNSPTCSPHSRWVGSQISSVLFFFLFWFVLCWGLVDALTKKITSIWIEREQTHAGNWEGCGNSWRLPDSDWGQCATDRRGWDRVAPACVVSCADLVTSSLPKMHRRRFNGPALYL